jgi:hypothetical protein
MTAKKFFHLLSHRNTNEKHLLHQIDLVATIFYLFATLILAWPLIRHIDTHLAGNDNDVYINIWANWWTHKALKEGRKLLFCDYQFFPIGVDLTFHSFSHFNSGLCLILAPFFGHIVAQNLTTLLAYVLTGISMYWLTKYLTGKILPALVAGYVYAFSPYHISQASHPVLNTTQWLPFFALFLIRMVQEQRKEDSLWAALFLFLTAISSWHLFLFASGFALLYFVYTFGHSFIHKKPLIRYLIVSYTILFIVSILLIGPLLYPVAKEIINGAGEEFVFINRIEQTDLLQFFHPPSHCLGIDKLLDIPPVKKSTYLGVSVLIVATYGLWHNYYQANFWAWGAVVFFLLALGPHIQIGDKIYEGLLPPWGRIIGQILRAPHRLTVMISLCLSVLVGFAMKTIQQQVPLRNMQGKCLLLIVVSIIALDTLHLPFPIRKPPVVSDFYVELSTKAEDLGVLELPFGRTPARYYAFYQVTHGKKIVNGIASRQPQEAYDYIQSNPFLAAIEQTGKMPYSVKDISRQLSTLSEDGIHYLILHKSLRYNHFDQWREYMAVSPIYEDEQLIVYRTSPPHGVKYEPVIDLKASLALDWLETDNETNYQAGQTTEIHTRWVALEAPSSNLDCQFILRDEKDNIVQTSVQSVHPEWLATDWPTGTIALGRYAFQFSPFLSSGEYSLALKLNSQGEPVGREVTVETFKITAMNRDFTPPQPKKQLSVNFSDMLHLVGYDLQLSEIEEQISINLYWQAKQRMSHSYKFFVHVIDYNTSEIITQSDVIPHNWTYPTTWWEKGEFVLTEIEVPTENLPPRRYTLTIGVYDPETGRRLPIPSKISTTAESNAFKLTNIEVIP